MSNKAKLIASAQKNLEKGLIAKAVKDYQQIVAAEPKDIRSRQKLAELCSRARMNDLAMDEFGIVAKHYANDGFYLKAIAVYKQMQKIDPSRPDIYRQLAELNQKQGLLGNALSEYRSLALHYEQKKMYPEAIEILQKMKEIDPEDLNIRAKIAEIFLHSRQKEEAIQEFREIVRELKQRNESGRALKLYDFFLPHFPDDLELKTGLAELLLGRGDIERGTHLLKDLVKNAPDDPQILAALAKGYRQSRDFQNERIIYQHLIKLRPEDIGHRQGLVRATLDQKDFARALNELEEWKEAFAAAGRIEELRQFYEELKTALPQERRVQATLRSIGELGDGGSAPAVAQEESPPLVLPVSGDEILEGSVLDEAVEDLEEIAELTEELEEVASGHPEEIPLSFLETAIEETAAPLITPAGEVRIEPPPKDLPPPAPAARAKTTSEAEGVELELELDLEEIPDESAATGPTVDDQAEVLDLALEAEEDEAGEEPAGVVELEIEATPAPEAREENLQEALEEVEFFFQQGMLDEAGQLCSRLLARHPGHPELLARQDSIEQKRHSSAGPPSAEPPSSKEKSALLLEPDGIDFSLPAAAAENPLALDEVDLESALGLEALEEEPAPASPAAAKAGKTGKAGIKTEVEIEDPDSHYHLGIAYKEMGLVDEAIREFEKAMREPSLAVACLMLQGICHFEQGALEKSEKAFKAGLARPNLEASEKLNLNFELGLLYESWNRPLEALESFQLVADQDLFHREVGERVSDLRRRLGLEGDEGTKSDAGGGKGNKNRVSYV